MSLLEDFFNEMEALILQDNLTFFLEKELGDPDMAAYLAEVLIKNFKVEHKNENSN